MGILIRLWTAFVVAAFLAIGSSVSAAEPTSYADLSAFLAQNPLPMRATAERRTSTMQDLAVDWYELPPDDGEGGALAVSGRLLLVVLPHGEIFWISPEHEAGPYAVPTRVPMNLEVLKASATIMATSGFDLRTVRVAGAYAEDRDTGVDLYVAHHIFEAGCISLQVSRIELSFDSKSGLSPAKGWRKIFRTEPCVRFGEASFHPFAGHQGGGRLIASDPEHLVLSVGDHELDGMANNNAPQDPGSPYGKIWKIRKDGTEAAIVASGVRNPQGLLRDAAGNIWETEHGPKGGDELNLLHEGRNYGWPQQTYGVGYGGGWRLNPLKGSHSDPSFEPPVFAWMPSIAVSALTEIRGPKFAAWHGDLIVGTLKDMSLRRIRLVDRHVVYDERIGLGERVRDIVSLADGRLALLTDTRRLGLIDEVAREVLVLEDELESDARADERLAQLRIATPPVMAQAYQAISPGQWIGYDLSRRPLVETRLLRDPHRDQAWTNAGQSLFKAHCASCHGMSNEPASAPTLDGVVGRTIGSVPGFAYSPRLSSVTGIWDEANLAAFISNPSATFAGTKMPRLDMTPEDAFKVAKYLSQTAGTYSQSDVGLLDLTLVDPDNSAWMTVEWKIGPILDAEPRHRLLGTVRARADKPVRIRAELLIPFTTGRQSLHVGDIDLGTSFRTYLLTQEFAALAASTDGTAATLALFLPVEAGLQIQFDRVGASILGSR